MVQFHLSAEDAPCLLLPLPRAGSPGLQHVTCLQLILLGAAEGNFLLTKFCVQTCLTYLVGALEGWGEGGGARIKMV